MFFFGGEGVEKRVRERRKSEHPVLSLFSFSSSFLTPQVLQQGRITATRGERISCAVDVDDRLLRSLCSGVGRTHV